MGEITLYPDRVVSRWYHNEETVRPGSILDLSKYFFYSLTIDADFTFGDLFALLDREGTDFLGAVLGERVDPVLEEGRRPPALPARGQINFLRVCNVHEGGCLRREFDGWGAWDEPYDGAWQKHADWPRAGPIAVGLTPVNQLLELPLRYDPDLVFRDEDGNEEYRTTIDITFIEFLKAVFYELTFHGSPEERDEVTNELRQRIEEIESGDATLIPVDEVLKSIHEKLRRGDPQE